MVGSFGRAWLSQAVTTPCKKAEVTPLHMHFFILLMGELIADNCDNTWE